MAQDRDDKLPVDAFKAAMRRLAGGVAVVTTKGPDRWYGMTATALMSLSMDPPSLALAVNSSASIHTPLNLHRAFCINLLDSKQEYVGTAFSTLPSEERFTVGDWQPGHLGLPYLVGAQATIFCTAEAMHTYGTHTIFIGKVLQTVVAEHVRPLVYLDGGFLTASSAA